MDTATLKQLLSQVITLVEQASREVMEIYTTSNFSVTYKDDKSPLTVADVAADKVLVAGLAALQPALPVVSEESLDALETLDASQPYWLVDPIDGTKEFIKRNGEFTVNVGLIINDQPVLGVIAAPALGLVYYGARECGAFKQVRGSAPHILQTHACYTRRTAAVSRSHLDDATKQWLQDCDISQTKAVGSSLKICYVADGTVDVVARFGSHYEWDIAAADAILRAAGGGIIYQTDKSLYRYGQPKELTKSYFAVGRV